MHAEVEALFAERFARQQEYGGGDKPVNRIQPLVSVLVFAYQHGPFIRDCLDGILMQEVDFPYEVIIGEDSSTDGTREICMEYADRHPDRIRLFLRDREESVYQDAAGGTAYFNIFWCFCSARGRYTAMCEGDDYWIYRRKLQTQVDFLEKHPDFAVCFHESNIRYEDERPQDAVERFSDFAWSYIDRDRSEYSLSELVEWELCPTASVVARHRDWSAVPAWMLMAKSIDILLNVWQCQRGNKAHFIPKSYSVYRRHEGGISRTHYGDGYHLNRLTGYLGIYEALEGDESEAIARVLAWHYQGIAQPGCLKENELLQHMARKTLDSLPPGPKRSPVQQRLARLARGIQRGLPYLVADEPEGRPSTFIQHAQPGSTPPPEMIVTIDGPRDFNLFWLQDVLGAIRKQGFQPRVVAFMKQGGRYFHALRTAGIHCDLLSQTTPEDTAKRFIRYFSERPAILFAPLISQAGLLACPRLKRAGIRTLALFPSLTAATRRVIDQCIKGANAEFFTAAASMDRVSTNQLHQIDIAANIHCEQLPMVRAAGGPPKQFTDTFQLKFIGSFTDSPSRIGDFLRAALELALRFPQVSVELIGNGPREETVRQLVEEANLGSRVRIETSVSFEGLKARIEDAHAVAIGSDCEAMGIPVLDVIACAVPLLGLRSDLAHSEVLLNGTTGRLLDNWSEELATQVQQWLDAPERWQKLVETVRAHHLARYGADQAGVQWRGFLSRLLQSVDHPGR